MLSPPCIEYDNWQDGDWRYGYQRYSYWRYGCRLIIVTNQWQYAVTARR